MTPTPLKISSNTPWLPPGIRARLTTVDPLVIDSAFTAAEKKILKKRLRIPVSLWAAKHRTITMGSLAGPWKNEITPYLTGIMDASFFPSVQTVIVCATPQTGKSESVHNCIGYAIDRAPGPALYVYPDRDTARENSSDRIQPMIQSSPRLRSFFTGVDDDVTKLRINLSHMPIYLGWARSASRLANKPIRYVVFDEVDKYPETANKKEADPISLGEKRTITYKWNRKIWKISTPTIETGPIWHALNNEAQAVFDFWVECPSCKALHLMKFEQIKFPKNERDPETVEAKDLAWYECPECQERWGDIQRNHAVARGKWVERKTGLELFEYLEEYRPQKIGFHLPAWLSYFVSLSEVAAAFLRGQKKKTKLKDFKNNFEAVPWLDYTVERDEEVILALRDERPRGRVPAGNQIAGITAAVDTQDVGFYYEIRAWGFGLIQESWQIREGYANSFAALEEILFNDQYLDADDNPYLVQVVLIDAMGHRTKEVYEWCRLHRGRTVPIKGEQRMNEPFKFSQPIEYYPGTDKRIPGGMRVLRINTTIYKDKLAGLVEIPSADPGAWHLHSETSVDWARQMTAEYVDDKGLWQVMGSRPNHAWDVSVYNLVAAEYIGLQFRAPKNTAQGAIDPAAMKPKRRILSKGINISNE